MTLKQIISGIVVVSLAGLLLFFIGPSAPVQTGQNQNQDEAGGITHLSGLEVGEDGFTSTATSTLGAQGAPAYFTAGGVEYAYVQMPFTTATNTPIIIPNPFGTATSTIESGILTQITTGVPGAAMTFDIATTSLGSYATTTSVLAKNITVAAGAQYTGEFIRPTGTTTPGIDVPTGVLPGKLGSGESLWFLRPSELLMLKIASTTVSNSWTGTLSVLFRKP